MAWLSICSSESPALEGTLRDAVCAKIARGVFEERDVEYLAKLSRPVVDGALELTDARLEKLRRLCQTWEVGIKQANITSHRKIVGPFIVGVKRALFPILRILLKDFIKQQRDFNAAAITLLADLSREERARPEKVHRQ